ncbi:hypothetical protein [Alsobacter sp. R-9]
MRTAAFDSVIRRTVVATGVAAALALSAPAQAAPMGPVGPAASVSAPGLPLVQVKNGRKAAGIAAIAGLTALGIGAAIASQNRGYYGGGGYYAQPSYGYAQPSYGYYGQPAYGYEEAPVVVEAPAYGYYAPAPVYVAPYGDDIPTYDYRPPRRHHAGGPAKRQMDNFRDAYR